ncbi:MAG: efflux RND transporter periplasmic adaptor subunit [Rhodospirillales bacterium]|nr:efflux RND transporter periplasmic adaptor subunit [Rhodospirillales bacterium]
MNKSYILALGVAVVVGGWIASGQFAGGESAAKSVDEGALPDSSVEVPLYEVRVKTLTATPMSQNINLLGRTEAKRNVFLRAETASRVVEVLVSKGQAVKAGDILVKLDQDDRLAKKREAQALLRQRQIEFEAATSLSKKNFRSKTKLAEARTLLDGARASLNQINIDIGNTVIRAPFDGVMDNRFVEVGDYLKIGENIATVLDLATIVVKANVAENDVAKLKIGAPAKAILVDGREIIGTVTFISKASESSTRTFKVEMEAPNPDSAIADGITAHLFFSVGETKAHRLTPAILALADNGVVGVKAVDGNGVVEFHPVTLLSDTPEGVWLSGLPSEVTLITVGQEFVKVGQKVKTTLEKGE